MAATVRHRRSLMGRDRGRLRPAWANDDGALVRVAYQRCTDVTWGQDTMALAGRTLEEAFALENLAWCQDVARKSLQLRIPKSEKRI